MDQLAVEKKLSLVYLFCAFAGVTSSITTGIAWGHWYRTLDQCVDRNCSCIIYGHHTYTVFLGGEQVPCIWVTFGPLLYVFCTVSLVCFHGYRVLFATNSPKTRSSRAMLAKMEPGESIQIEAVSQESTSPLPTAYWVTVSVLTGLFTIYALIHFSIYVDGYYTTCNQYRKTLEQFLGIHGSALPVIYSRLSCQGKEEDKKILLVDVENLWKN
ncbi:unnamed protein product [Callosobruchus maculatus]|uniref:Uncharacterized protein n=1 Tax=Callosobruchus maculatus TaxID=64391 RepID=A0A653BUH8_CALMS|nr:unnamed protein product [Callosobruchus maculatus]